MENMKINYDMSLLYQYWETIIMTYAICDSVVIIFVLGTYYALYKSPNGYHWVILIFEVITKLVYWILIIIFFVYVDGFYNFINLIINKNCASGDDL